MSTLDEFEPTEPLEPVGPFEPFEPFDPTRNLPPPPPQKKRRRKRRWGCLVAQFGCLFLGIGLAVMLAVALVVVLVVAGDLADRLETGLAELETYDAEQMFQTTRVYDRHGNLLHEVFGEGRRTLITLADMPQHLIDATIATEDDSFWENPGVDIKSIIRAGFQWIREGDIVSGASTITQQVVRQVAFDYEYRTEQSVQRKMEEAILAMMLDERKTKSEILELYLNLNNYGNLAYGVEAAAQVYFGIPASKLNLAQATLIVGLPQAPADLNPLSPDAGVRRTVKDRQRLVLDLMVAHGYLTQQEADAAYNEPLVLMNPDVPLQAPHFTMYAEEELKKLLDVIGLDPALFDSGGLEVYTTLDLRYNTMIEQVAREHVDALRDEHNMTNAAVIVLHPPTGEIMAMVGSINFEDKDIGGQVNVTTSARQPGSAMKPLTYAAALEHGFSAAHLLWDTPTQIGTGGSVYIPVNYDHAFHGPVRMRTALANSYNVPAVQMLRQTGVENLLALAHRMGIRSLGEDASHYGLSLTLGGGEVTPLELTQAFAVFANEGTLVPAVSVLCVLDSNGNILYQYEGRCPKGAGTPNSVNAVAQRILVLDPRIAYIINDILADNVARTPAMGSDSPLFTGDLPASVKTGTSNDWKDNWTVGYTRNLAIGVWTGNSDSSPMVNISGLHGAAPIWHDVMLGIYGNQDLLAVLANGGQLVPDYHNPPPGMSRREVCRPSSLQDPATDCPRTDVEWFLDSPAAVPDGSGALVAPAPSEPPPAQLDEPDSPSLTDIGHGIWVAMVLPIPPELQASLAPQPTGGPALPPPRYCVAPLRYQQLPEAQAHLEQLYFVAPPPVREDEIRARLWAEDHGIPVLPYMLCDDAILSALSVPQFNQNGIEARWYITSPRRGEKISGVVPIIGTAEFPGGHEYFYKLMVGRGHQPTEYVTFGETNENRVTDGVLGELHADALDPGDWTICLEIVIWDGNYLTPACVNVEIEH